MSKINLTEEELKQLLKAVNAGAEPSPELAGKIFPSLMEKLGQEGKFDFETLNRIKIPTIEYAGKRSQGVILASAAALGQSAPLQVVRSFGSEKERLEEPHCAGGQFTISEDGLSQSGPAD